MQGARNPRTSSESLGGPWAASYAVDSKGISAHLVYSSATFRAILCIPMCGGRNALAVPLRHANLARQHIRFRGHALNVNLVKFAGVRAMDVYFETGINNKEEGNMQTNELTCTTSAAKPGTP